MNLNDKVRCTLTEAGLVEAIKSKQVFGSNELHGHTLHTSLWKVMAALGPKLYMGGPLLIENNEIEVTP